MSMHSAPSPAATWRLVAATLLLLLVITPAPAARVAAGGQAFGCVIRHDGSVACWGENQMGQLGLGTTSLHEVVPTVVPGLDAVVDLDAGIGHVCAVRADGGVRCWGRNENGALGDGSTDTRLSPVIVSDGGGALVGVTQVSTGAFHSCARRDDGSAACWGSNRSGQLGNGDRIDQTVAQPVAGLADVVEIAAGNQHSCARVADGGVYCWGMNDLGQLGDGGGVPRSDVPVAVVGIDDAIAITARGDHTCAVRANGNALCWGSNEDDQLGNSPLASSATPVAVGYVGGVTSIRAGTWHTCAIHGNGAVRCWGENGADQAGPGASTDVALPGRARELALGTDHTCARLVDGSAYCWGSNMQAQLGAGMAGDEFRSTPVPVLQLDDAVAISVGSAHSCVRTQAGGVKCWGINHRGQLGDGSTRDRLTPPRAIPGLSGVTALSVGSQFGCLVANGTARCLGRNDDGQLGLGTRSDGPVASPMPVAGLGTVSRIDSGFAHACAVVAGGGVRCWGLNGFGQLGNGDTESSATPVAVVGIGDATDVAVGGSHACALVAGGAVRCWGNGYQGQLGNGETFMETSTPVAVVGLSGAVAIDAGSGHTCALLGDGSVRCWGANTSRQIGSAALGSEFSVPTVVQALGDVVEISTGNAHTCARLGDGSVRCWGDNGYAQLGLGTVGPDTAMPTAVGGLVDVVSVSAGEESSCVVLASGEARCWGYSGGGLLGNGEIFRTEVPVLVLGTSPWLFRDGFD